ncbi:eCIS core domain-containing protein [Limnofasciculus baicalensis]|uniref:DUF4157 domain-containing protein n=1 Tax=Limnofasciculus baicalensis BBK-W-15 TaxID=2699891 RepID=A0AAE3GRJ2_9CYAN|nr:DUF4157 domain-containing protein [Limnofasciculus baicalensis]MCP2729229.1 DUF4157 domain-containing protein [Limnofasciculus baicalensis BBK-W-15]
MRHQHLSKTQNGMPPSGEAIAPPQTQITHSSTHPIEQLQGSIGNRAVNQLLANQPLVQTKPLFQGLSHELLAESQTIQNNEPIQAKEADSVSVSEVQPENKTGLPDQLKTGIENLSGIGMDDVRVHYNSSKPTDVQALAYTQGTDIHVASGQEKHLPHEAWHIVQQKQGRVKPSFKLKNGIAIDDSPNLEREADIMGAKAKTISHKVHHNATIESNSFVQSPITANSTQQLTSNSSPNRDAIQRVAVDAWGGTFSDSNYAVKREKGYGNGTLIGAYIKITFTPNEHCPKNVKIGLMQIVRVIGADENPGLQKDVLKSTERWAIDRQSDSNPVYGSSDAESGKKSKTLTDNQPSILAERENPFKEDSPIIEVGAQLGERWRNDGQNAILTDDPRVFLNTNREQKMLFETTAVVLEGKYKGLALGTVSWGWTKAAGVQQLLLEPFQLVQNSGSTENFKNASKVWNEAAEEHELVPIPTIRDSNYRPSKCFLTTACVEYLGLSDDCEELTTLRRFRDTYLLSKSNGKDLVELYYEHSPKIVAAIHEQENKEEILKGLYRIIKQCVDSIQQGDNEWAYQTYCKMVIESKEKFIPKCLISIPSY